MGDLRTKAGMLIERFVDEAISSGLTWDETVAVFGLASKSLAQAAAAAGEGTAADCEAHARGRLEEAFARDIQIIVTEPEPATMDAATYDSALLATARRRPVAKPH